MTVAQIAEIAWVALAALLIAIVLLHSPKGDGLGGIGGQGQLFTSTKSAEKGLNRITWGIAIAFLGLTIAQSAGWLG
ncbi:MAG: preprotein translocase subunit SecG [Cyanobacteria bacterium QS_8_64_29]|nr:MAG: preprotein translocase subunit SecG [Cyanobacteria bacterium QS_8_64_29]